MGKKSLWKLSHIYREAGWLPQQFYHFGLFINKQIIFKHLHLKGLYIKVTIAKMYVFYVLFTIFIVV